MKSPFTVDYTNLNQVISFAKSLAKGKFIQYVVKHPDRDNYNITMQLQKSLDEGCQLVWSSNQQN